MSRRSFLAIILILAATVLPARGSRLDLDGTALIEASKTGRPIRIDAGSLGRIAVRLWPNPLHAVGAVFTETGAGGTARPVVSGILATLAGEVEGMPHSVVRLTVTPSWVGGFVAANGAEVWFHPDDYEHPTATLVREPLREPAVPLPPDRDVVIEVPAASHGGTEVAIGVGNCVLVTCGTLTALVALDGDKYFRDLGASTCFARQTEVLNAVDGLYALQGINIDLRVVQQNCRTAYDFGTSATGAEPYLENVRTSWNTACPGSCPDRSFTFVFTGFDFSGGTVGIAYRPGVCDRLEPDPLLVVDWRQRCEYGYGVAQMVASTGSYTASLFLKTKLTAHEIGHLFNATHEVASGCDTAAPRNGDIMCDQIQEAGPNSFSSASVNEIRSHAEQTVGYAWRL